MAAPLPAGDTGEDRNLFETAGREADRHGVPAGAGSGSETDLRHAAILIGSAFPTEETTR